MQQHFVALAADADATEPEVAQLALHLEDPVMLPFVLFVDAQGGFLSGYAGKATPSYLLELMEELIAEPN